MFLSITSRAGRMHRPRMGVLLKADFVCLVGGEIIVDWVFIPKTWGEKGGG